MSNEGSYKKTILEGRIDRIKQRLFFYDNRPSDGEVVELIDEWRNINKQLKQAKGG